MKAAAKHPSFGDFTREEYDRIVNAPCGKSKEIRDEIVRAKRIRKKFPGVKAEELRGSAVWAAT